LSGWVGIGLQKAGDFVSFHFRSGENFQPGAERSLRQTSEKIGPGDQKSEIFGSIAVRG